MCVKSLQSCPTLCKPMDYNLPGSSVHGILQASILEWVATLSSRGSSRPRDQTQVSYVSCIGRRVLYHQHRLESPILRSACQFLGFSSGSESACNVGDLGLIPGLGRSPAKGTAAHSSILAWRTPCAVYGPWGCKESDPLNEFHFVCQLLGK